MISGASKARTQPRFYIVRKSRPQRLANLRSYGAMKAMNITPSSGGHTSMVLEFEKQRMTVCTLQMLSSKQTEKEVSGSVG